MLRVHPDTRGPLVGVSAGGQCGCVIAHFLADLQDDDHAELMWDERALAAVDGVTDERAQEFDPSLQVRTFMPALYGSLADDHRRWGDPDRARYFLDRAWSGSGALSADPYGELVRSVLEMVGRALAEGSTDRLRSRWRCRAARRRRHRPTALTAPPPAGYFLFRIFAPRSRCSLSSFLRSDPHGSLFRARLASLCCSLSDLISARSAIFFLLAASRSARAAAADCGGFGSAIRSR